MGATDANFSGGTPAILKRGRKMIDSTYCDCCGCIFDTRAEPFEVVNDTWWVCGYCVGGYELEALVSLLTSKMEG